MLPAVRRLIGAADVVHVHGLLNPTSSGASRLAIAGRRPVVIGPFGTMSRYTFSYRRSVAKRLYFEIIDAPNLRRASAIHFTTTAECADAAWHGIDATRRTYIVPPPYRSAQPTGRTRPAGVRAAPIVLFLGRLHPVKGIDLLLEGWGRVLQRYPTAELRIAGAGSAGYTAYLRSRPSAYGYSASSVKFLGFIGDEDKQHQLAEASIAVLPSRHENFGIAVLDAVAAGVPVVVTAGVQLAPWVEAEALGHVVERAPGPLAQAIVEALSDASLQARVGAEGPTAVARAFAPGAIAPALQGMYRGAVAHQRGIG